MKGIFKILCRYDPNYPVSVEKGFVRNQAEARVSNDALFKEYLAPAQEAEQNAQREADAEVRRAWRKIADGYLMLANHYLAAR